MSNRLSVPWIKIVLRTVLVLVAFCFCGIAGKANAAISDTIAIAAGGPAESNANGGDVSFIADTDYSGGGDNSHTSHTINLTQPGANAAPMGVYQYGRAGATTYTIPGLVAGSQYSVLLHFSENYFTAAGKRVFNVAINGTTVLSDFDIYKTAGAEYTAVVESFVATANSSGEIVIAFTDGTANQPLIDGIEIRSSSTSTCTAVTSAPTGLAMTETTSSSVSLSWTAPAPPTGCTVSSYVVNDGTATPPTVVAASGVAGTTYTVSGLAASTTYYFSVAAVDSFGTSAASTIISDTTSPLTSAPTITTQPVAQSVTAGQTATFSVVATGSPAPTYQWYMNSAAISGATAASYTTPATTTSNSGESFYVVVTNSVGTVTSSIVTLTVNPSTGDVIAINFEGPAVSNSGGGDASFVADEYFTGGGKATPTTATISTTAAGANAAPMAVYQTQRDGVFTYTIPGLVAGDSYTVLLHFAEIYFTAAGDREFNVAINGTSVLTNFDQFAAAGGKDIAVVKSFTATANSSGQIVVSFTGGAANQPSAAGIEIRSSAAPTCTAVTSAPTGLAVTTTTSSSISLSWTAPTPPTGCTVSSYVVNDGTTTPPTVVAASGVTGTTYTVTGLAASTTYYLSVAAVDSFGTSAASAPVTGMTLPVTAAPAPPTGLTATAISSSQINLTWTASTTAGVEYLVFQNGSQLATVSGTTYSSTGLAASTTYSYTVEATDSSGTSTADGPVSTETLSGTSGPVAPPTSLTAVGSAYNQIDLRWVASTTPAPNTAPVNYLVYRSTSPTFTPSAANLMGTTIGITNYLDSNYPATLTPPAGPGVQPDTTYYYEVVASTPAGTSTPATASATSLPAAPSTAAPETLTGLTAMAENANEIDLIWNSTNSGAGTDVTTYYIYRSTTSPFTPATTNLIGTTKSNWFQDALCTASTQYYYQVLAKNSIGVSPTSEVVTATTPVLDSELWGGAPFWDASGIPAKPAGATMMVKFLNRTNGKYTDDQITYTATINGVKVDTSIAANPTYAMGANSAGRMYFFLNDPTANENNTNFWDFIEFTVGATSINMDTTRVDAFDVKIAFNLLCGDGTNIALGENEQTFTEDRAVTFQRYANGVPSTPGGDFQSDLIYAPYRIIEPGGAGFNAGGANQNYYSTYISDIWAFNGITIPEAGPNGSGLGSEPSLSAAIYRHTAPTSGTPEFNAAGALTNQGMWGNPASFYQQEPYDHYAQWIEAQAINMQQYAFPYNDAGGYSSDIGCSNPETLLVAVGW